MAEVTESLKVAVLVNWVYSEVLSFCTIGSLMHHVDIRMAACNLDKKLYRSTPST